MPAVVDLQAVVMEVIATLQPSAEESAAAISYEAMPLVCGDRLQLLQVIQNLIGNALKYARIPSAGLQISVAACQTDSEHRISVQDNPKLSEWVFRRHAQPPGQYETPVCQPRW